MRVFLDDERAAPPGWVRVSWPHEAIALLETGTVAEISLDHDLGDDARGTGYDVILWMERAVAMEGFKPPRIRVHSANASARIKMEAGVEAIDRLAGGRRRSPPSVGVKVGADGVPLTFKGSTLICPVSERTDPQFHRGLVEIYADRHRYRFSAKVAYLPPPSYHVTIFACASERKREPARWPAAVPLAAPIEECNRSIEDRLRDFRADWEMPLRFRVDDAEHPRDRLPLSFGLLPADVAESRKLRSLRDRLSAHVGIRAQAHAEYRFHVTLGYALDWLTPDEEADFLAQHAAWRIGLAHTSPQIALHSLEFYIYNDMWTFDRRLVIR